MPSYNIDNAIVKIRQCYLHNGIFYTGSASVTSNHEPRAILAPVRFLVRKAEWSARAVLVVT